MYKVSETDKNKEATIILKWPVPSSCALRQISCYLCYLSFLRAVMETVESDNSGDKGLLHAPLVEQPGAEGAAQASQGVLYGVGVVVYNVSLLSCWCKYPGLYVHLVDVTILFSTFNQLSVHKWLN